MKLFYSIKLNKLICPLIILISANVKIQADKNFKYIEVWGDGTPEDLSSDLYLQGISSSSEDLAFAYKVEQNLLSQLSEFDKQLEAVHQNCQKENKKNIKILVTVRKKLKEMLKYFWVDFVSPREHVLNPLNMFLLIKRLVKMWPPKVQTLNSMQPGFKNIKCTKAIPFPAKTLKEFPHLDPIELEFGAPYGLIEIERLTTVQIRNFTENNLFADRIVQAKQKLSYSDLELIASVAGKIMKYNSQVAWTEAALKVAERDKVAVKEIKRLKKLVVKTKKHHDDVLMEEGLAGADLDNDDVFYTNHEPFDKKLLQTPEFRYHHKNYQDTISKFPLFTDIYGGKKSHLNFANQSSEDSALGKKSHVLYQGQQNHMLLPVTTALCSGQAKSFRPPKLDRNNKCFLLHHHDPFLLLNPFKIEVKNYEPFAYVCHDFYSEKEIALFLSLSKGRMKNTPIPININRTDTYSRHRTSKIFYASDRKYLELLESSVRLEHLTTMDLIGKEWEAKSQNYQVMNYGIGGSVRQHMDAVGTRHGAPMQEFLEAQNIITILLYLSDTVAGGSTVFPWLGYAVPPEKGSLSVYFNYRSDLSQDSRVVHQGCPVAAGHKWVATKWVRWIPQMFNLPCHRIESHHTVPEKLWPQLKQFNLPSLL